MNKTTITKRHIILLISFLMVSLVYPQKWITLGESKSGLEYSTEIIESNYKTHIVKVSIHGFYDNIVFRKGTEYHQLYMHESGSTSIVGEPQLPIINQLIGIPHDATYNVTIKDKKWEKIKIGKLFPVQEQVRESDLEPDFMVVDSIYGVDTYVPPLLSIGNEQNWRGIRNVGIHICPFKYYPLQNSLEVLKDFVLQIDFSGASSKSAIRPSSIANAQKWHIFDNDVSSFPVSDNAKTSASSTDYDYLIIVGNIPLIANSGALKDFCKWKAFKGYKTKVVSTNTIGSTPALIKSYIAREDSLHDIKYVLLIGDQNKIPMKVVRNVVGNDTVKSDYWYGCINGNQYDFQAEIPIGRFSMNSLQDFMQIVNKSISYEKSYSDNYKDILLVAHKEGAPGKYQRCSEDIRTAYNNLSFFTAYGASSIDPNYGGDDATNNDVVDYINSGMHIVNYRGHGEPTHWGIDTSEGKWNTSNELFEFDQIDNINTRSIYFNVCCQTGDIEYEPCFMEAFTRSSEGAIACLAATEDIYTIPADFYNKKLFSNLLTGGIWNLGLLNIESHKSTIEYSVSRGKFNALSFICGGDPSLEIWTDTIQSYSNVELASQDGNITISSPSFGYSDAVSIVSESGELIDKEDNFGTSVTISAPSGNFYIVANKHNYYPYVIFVNSSDYIQNETINDNYYYGYAPMNIGYDVSTEIDNGNVLVKSGSKLRINNGAGGVVIKNGFECEIGAELVIE